MPQTDPCLERDYKAACVRTNELFREAREKGFPADLMLQVGEATREETRALA